MSLDAASKQALQALARGRSKSQLKAVFAQVRAHTDRTLLAAIAPAKHKAKRKTDPFVREIAQTLRPILGPAAEKADFLVVHMARKHRRKLAYEPKGVADAVRKLRADFKDAQIRAGAKALMAEMEALYAPRETVV